MSHYKGKRGELDWVNFLKEIGVECERNLNERRSGNEGDVSSDLPCEFQVKRRKQPSVYRALEEAKEAAEGTGRHPVAVLHRINGRGRKPDRLVAMPWEDFREIVGLLRSEGIW